MFRYRRTVNFRIFQSFTNKIRHGGKKEKGAAKQDLLLECVCYRYFLARALTLVSKWEDVIREPGK